MATPTTISSQPAVVRTVLGVSVGRTLPPVTVPVPALDFANGQAVAAGAASAASAAFDAANDRLVELCSSTDAYYTVAASPTAVAATAGNQLLPAGTVRYVYVGMGNKIAVIQSTASGTVQMVPAILGSYPNP
jgi:hypothetical protein